MAMRPLGDGQAPLRFLGRQGRIDLFDCCKEHPERAGGLRPRGWRLIRVPLHYCRGAQNRKSGKIAQDFRRSALRARALDCGAKQGNYPFRSGDTERPGGNEPRQLRKLAIAASFGHEELDSPARQLRPRLLPPLNIAALPGCRESTKAIHDRPLLGGPRDVFPPGLQGTGTAGGHQGRHGGVDTAGSKVNDYGRHVRRRNVAQQIAHSLKTFVIHCRELSESGSGRLRPSRDLVRENSPGWCPPRSSAPNGHSVFR